MKPLARDTKVSYSRARRLSGAIGDDAKLNGHGTRSIRKIVASDHSIVVGG